MKLTFSGLAFDVNSLKNLLLRGFFFSPSFVLWMSFFFFFLIRAEYFLALLGNTRPQFWSLALRDCDPGFLRDHSLLLLEPSVSKPLFVRCKVLSSVPSWTPFFLVLILIFFPSTALRSEVCWAKIRFIHEKLGNEAHFTDCGAQVGLACVL